MYIFVNFYVFRIVLAVDMFGRVYSNNWIVVHCVVYFFDAFLTLSNALILLLFVVVVVVVVVITPARYTRVLFLRHLGQ